MHLMPGGASTLLHDDGDGKNKPYGQFIHNINKGKKFEFKMADARGADTHSVKCKNNREHIIVYGTADSFCDSTIAKHRGSYEGEEIGCTVVMDPTSKVNDISTIPPRYMVALTTAAKNIKPPDNLLMRFSDSRKRSLVSVVNITKLEKYLNHFSLHF
mmetsp:Transcript_21079/g.21481  ORF Transcript_21079/g.21481 Transcript_21079/m.21481 type:complete len:158 (+) Transcript_21079:405-878(+)